MNIAIEQARIASTNGETPVGAVIVKDNEIISKSHNKTIELCDCTAHAEILVIREASIKLNSWRLSECSLYVTLEPCIMCFGAIKNARISKLIFGAYNHESGFDNHYNLQTNLKYIGGIEKEACKSILDSHFNNIR